METRVSGGVFFSMAYLANVLGWLLSGQCRGAPPPHTPWRGSVGPLDELDQALPFQWATVTESPTAQTESPSSARLPQTPRRELVVPLGEADQALPSQCTMVPASPAAQMSSPPPPQTPRSDLVVPLGETDQA